MKPEVMFSWAGDGVNTDAGTATFFPNTFLEVSIHFDSFKDAHRLHQAIVQSNAVARGRGREELAAEIRKVLP